jgi:general secretion pathway protein D
MLVEIAPSFIFRLLLLSALSLGGLTACKLPLQVTSERHVSESPATAAALTPPSLRPIRLPAMPPVPVPRPAQEVFSVVVNDVPVKTLLFALARDNKLNVDIHPSVGGRVTLNATDQTLSQLLERIAAQSDIRYDITDNLLRVQPDAPYLANYTVDYVNLQRQSSSSVAVTSSLGGSSGTQGSGSGSSDSSIKSSADNRFWDTLVSNVCQIVLTSNQNRNQRDEQASLQRQQDREDRLKVAVELSKALQPAQGTGGAGQTSSGGNVVNNVSGGAADLMRQVMGTFSSITNSAQGIDNNGGNNGNNTSNSGGNNATGNGGSNANGRTSGNSNSTGQGMSSTSTSQGASCGTTAGSTGTSGSSGANNPLMVNKESGVLGVNTTSKGHAQVRAFIDRVMAGARRQVLIEATVVEVQLSAASQSGVNWSQLVTKGAANGLTIGLGASAPGYVNSATTTGNAVSISYSGNNAIGTIAAAINLLESFGQTKVLSSPKLSVINNQTAIIKVVDDYVYVTVSTTPASFSSTGTVLSPATYTSNVNTIPVGFVMTVTPQISDSNDVTLNVHPSITRVISTITDPNPTLLNSSPPIINLIPVVQTRELESVLRVQSGEIAVLGGLMQESNVSAEQGIPGINRVPGLGAALGQRSENRTKTELIVFMRPVVIKDASVNGDYKAFKSQLPTSTFFNGGAADAWESKK